MADCTVCDTAPGPDTCPVVIAVGVNTTETLEPSSALPVVTPLQLTVPTPAVTGLQAIASSPVVVWKTAMGRNPTGSTRFCGRFATSDHTMPPLTVPVPLTPPA